MKKTIINLFEESVCKYADKTLLLEKKAGKFEPTSYRDVHTKVMSVGAGLVCLGVKPRDKVSILSEGCNDWIVSELALLYAGAISVPLSIKLEESNDLLFRLTHAEVSVIIISSLQLPKIRKIKDSLPLLKHIVVLGGADTLDNNEITLEEIAINGEVYLQTNLSSFVSIGNDIQNDDYATITYTSGTTADPKGVILTHRNYTANVEQALALMSIPSWYRTLIILPLDHCFAHVVGFYIMIACGASVATVQVGRTPMETLKNIPVNIREVKPHFLLSVPALAKNFRKSIESSIASKGAFTNALFSLALKTAYAYNRDGYSKGTGVSVLLKPFVMLFDKVLFAKVREAFGGELEFFVGGGALLDAELQRFFYAIGIPMYQGYGLSEATPIISTNNPTLHRFGSSGELVRPLEIKIMDEQGEELSVGEKGEIVIKGENVMAGYWKNPMATAETVKDGWLYTGDMGYMGNDGLVYVLGRFKSLLIASDGEKYSPEGMEESFVEQSAFIDQVIIYNNQNPYTTALIVPNKEAIKRYLDKHHHHGAAKDYSVMAIELLQKELDKYKCSGEFAGSFPERWLPTTFAVIDEPFSEKNGLVNSTMKVVRNKVEQMYRPRIDYMYTTQGKDIYNTQNKSCFLG